MPALLAPLLTDPHVDYVKGCYTRPLEAEGSVVPAGGGRVTELTARPLLNALWPELAGFMQPLGGEYAGRRSALEAVPFVSGYGVEVGLLVDLLERSGLAALAQVDLGVRRHTSQGQEALGRMAGQILSTVLARAGRRQAGGLLTQFRHDGAGFVPHSSPMAVDERPCRSTGRCGATWSWGDAGGSVAGSPVRRSVSRGRGAGSSRRMLAPCSPCEAGASVGRDTHGPETERGQRPQPGFRASRGAGGSRAPSSGEVESAPPCCHGRTMGTLRTSSPASHY